MKKQSTLKKIKISVAFGVVALAGIFVLVNSCSKSSQHTTPLTTTENSTSKTASAVTQNMSQTFIVTVANVRKSGNGNVNEVMFNELAELFTVSDATVLSTLQSALNNNAMVTVTVDPWKGIVLQAVATPQQAATAVRSSRLINREHGAAYTVDVAHTNPDVINNIAGAAIINTTSDTLTSVIPDMATAQLMFDYITHQCCALPGPYTIDYCIPFQYCEDGCYARAHKMCWIINTKYNYATQKVFSFANAGSDELCVQGLKWGGCCVNWWYHVAPLVNIKTPAGTKAYVIDPAMFDQPVLLATWLHAQENPACCPSGDNPHVTMINIQPTSSYTPDGTTGYLFYTDPTFSSTDSYLLMYRSLTTCP